MIAAPAEEPADSVAEEPPAVPSPSIGFAKASPGHALRSAAVADIVPASSSKGTKIVIVAVSVQPAAFSIITVIVLSETTLVVVNTFPTTSPGAALIPLSLKV